jgi:hypothetical protein
MKHMSNILVLSNDAPDVRTPTDLLVVRHKRNAKPVTKAEQKYNVWFKNTSRE